MRKSGNWWIGIAAGLTLGAAVVVTVDQVSEPASAQGGFAVSAEQLRINQRISQAAVRRVNALIAAVTGRPAPKPRTPGTPARVELTIGQLQINQRISQAALRRVAALERVLNGGSGRATTSRPGKDRVTLSARQLLINQRISQAAVRRVNALAAAVEAAGR